MRRKNSGEPMEFHEVCSLFPVMTDEKFREFKVDIAANGQLDPISTYRGKIVDGRHRYWVCSKLQIAPKFQEWDGEGSRLGRVTCKNLSRLMSGETPMR
jgi:hypothetical protein